MVCIKQLVHTSKMLHLLYSQSPSLPRKHQDSLSICLVALCFDINTHVLLSPEPLHLCKLAFCLAYQGTHFTFTSACRVNDAAQVLERTTWFSVPPDSCTPGDSAPLDGSRIAINSALLALMCKHLAANIIQCMKHTFQLLLATALEHHIICKPQDGCGNRACTSSSGLIISPLAQWDSLTSQPSGVAACACLSTH